MKLTQLRDKKDHDNKDFEKHNKDKTKKHFLVEKLGTLGNINDAVKNIINLMSFFLMAEDFTAGKCCPVLYQIMNQYTN